MGKPVFSFWSDGNVVAYIDGKKYNYKTDPVYHGQWESQARFRPWAVLHAIKQQVDQGYAKFLGKIAPPEAPAPVPSNAPMLQKSLGFKDWLEIA